MRKREEDHDEPCEITREEDNSSSDVEDPMRNFEDFMENSDSRHDHDAESESAAEEPPKAYGRFGFGHEAVDR
jgi:hypothetical protein